MTFVCISMVVASLTIVAWFFVVSVAADMTFEKLFDSMFSILYCSCIHYSTLTHFKVLKIEQEIRRK